MSYILRNWKYQIRQLAILMKFFFNKYVLEHVHQAENESSYRLEETSTYITVVMELTAKIA